MNEESIPAGEIHATRGVKRRDRGIPPTIALPLHLRLASEQERFEQKTWCTRNEWFTRLNPVERESARKLMFAYERGQPGGSRLIACVLILVWTATRNTARMYALIQHLLDGGSLRCADRVISLNSKPVCLEAAASLHDFIGSTSLAPNRT